MPCNQIATNTYDIQKELSFIPTAIFHLTCLKGHCIEFKYYADGIHSGLTPPGAGVNNSGPAGITKAEIALILFTPLSHHYGRVYSHHTKFYTVPL